MSYTPFKVVNINNTGTGTKYGSDNLDDITRIFNGEVVAGKRPFIKNPWYFHDDALGEIGHIEKKPSVKKSGRYIPAMVGACGQGVLNQLVLINDAEYGLDLEGYFHQFAAGINLADYNGLRSFFNAFLGFYLFDLELGFTVPFNTNRRVFVGFSTDQYMPKSDFPISAGGKGFFIGFTPATLGQYHVYSSNGTTTNETDANFNVLTDVVQKLRIYTTINDEFVVEIDNQSGTIAYGSFSTNVPPDGDMLYFHFNIQPVNTTTNPTVKLRYIQYEDYY